MVTVVSASAGLWELCQPVLVQLPSLLFGKLKAWLLLTRSSQTRPWQLYSEGKSARATWMWDGGAGGGGRGIRWGEVGGEDRLCRRCDLRD